MVLSKKVGRGRRFSSPPGEDDLTLGAQVGRETPEESKKKKIRRRQGRSGELHKNVRNLLPLGAAIDIRGLVLPHREKRGRSRTSERKRERRH